MRTLPPGLAAQLAAGATTLCHCWRLTRRDGVSLGFTDHDRDLEFEQTVFRADSGLTATGWEAKLGLGVDTMDAHGALTSEALSEDDLAAGLWDDADVELFRADWTAPEDRVLLFRGSIGEVARGELAFSAELRGLAHRLNQPVGRVFSRPCDAVLGDLRCQIDLDEPALKGTGTVAGVIDNRILTVEGLEAFRADWFSGGRLAWTGGANAGREIEVKGHRIFGGFVSIELWERAAGGIAAGDPFMITAGCDKRFETCRDKFDNVLNHRGFPHMPGNDVAFTYAVPDEGEHDGGSFFS